jgi:hypothetical protein
MLPFLIMLAVACAAFWRLVIKLLFAAAIFLVIVGLYTVIHLAPQVGGWQ